MANLNKVLLMGNLTRDPELRFTPKGTAVCEIGLAINRNFKADNGEKREETTFVDVTLWSHAAEAVNDYFAKGDPIFIEGRLQMDQWEDKQTGQKRTKLRVVAEGFEFVGDTHGPKSRSGGRGERPEREERQRYDQRQERTGQSTPPRRPAAHPVDPDLEPEGDGDIPF